MDSLFARSYCLIITIFAKFPPTVWLVNKASNSVINIISTYIFRKIFLQRKYFCSGPDFHSLIYIPIKIISQIPFGRAYNHITSQRSGGQSRSRENFGQSLTNIRTFCWIWGKTKWKPFFSSRSSRIPSFLRFSAVVLFSGASALFNGHVDLVNA